MASGRLKANLVVNGTGEANGGDYRKVVMNGEGTVRGHVLTDTCKIRGTGTVKGDLQAKVLGVMGTCGVDGNLSVEKMSVMGTCDVTQNFTGEKVRVKGELRVGGDVGAESLKVSGAFDIAGLLNAENLDVSLYGPSHAKEVGGSTIRVKPFLAMLSGHKTLTTDIVEADNIIVSHTFAKVVRGKCVEIGAGCEIDLVEYQTELKISKGAIVKEKRKV